MSDADRAEGAAAASDAAARNARVSLALAKCVSCEQRPWTAHPAALLVTLHWTFFGAMAGLLLRVFVDAPLHHFMVVTGALTLGYAVARRIGLADMAVRSAT